MSAPTDPSAVLRGLASGIPEPQARWSRGEGLGGNPTPAPEPKPEPKAADPKAEPKPTSASTATPAADAPDAKPATDTKPDTPKPDAKPKAEPKKFNPHVGKTLTQLGVPPSAVRNIKSGEPMKGVKGIAKGQWNAGQHWAGKGAEKLAKVIPSGMGKTALKSAAKFLPGVGSAIAAYSAFQNFRSGDWVGGVLNLVGVIPGPIGWIALGSSMVWEATGFGKRYKEWQEPDGVDTHILMRDAKDVANVKEIDAALRTAQQNVFSFQDGPSGSVWDRTPPPAIELNTAEVKAEAEAWLTGISDHFEAIDKAMTGSGEQYFTEQRAALAPHLAAMAKLKGTVKGLTDQLDAMDKGAKSAYDAVTGANAAARGQLASSGSLDDAGPATTAETKVRQGLSAVKAAESKIEKLWSDTPPAVVLVRGDTPTASAPAPEKKTEPVKPISTAPAAVTPAAQTPAAATPAKTEAPTKGNDDLSKILSQLGNKTQTPTSGNPLGTGTGSGGGSPLGTGAGTGQGGGTPLSSSKPDTSEKSEPKKLVDDKDKKETDRKKEEPKKLDEKSLSTPKPEQSKAAVPGQEQKPAAVPAAVAAPGAAAPTPAQQNAAAAAQAAEPSKEVDVKGQKTTFPDAKTAKLAELLAKADPTHPVSLADAAKSAGLTPPVAGQDPGTQVNPAQAKPGDIMVAADKQFMLLGDGKFYDLTDYKVVGASELPQNLGDRAGYFHLNDPNPGAPVPTQPGEAPAGAPAPATPQQPVSGQTGGVQNPVSNATGANPLPTDGSQGGGQGGQQQTSAPTGPGGVPSVGAPGVPKPAAPGAGPANAESTSTGTGQGGVSSGGGALDPGAVR